MLGALCALEIRNATASDYPISITIQASDTTVVAGNTVNLRLALTNISSTTFSLPNAIDPADGGFYYKIEMIGPDGKAVELNDYGQCLYESLKRPDCFRSGSRFAKTLSPGDEIRENIVLSDVFTISKLGEYIVQVSRDLPKDLGGFHVTSNMVRINVVK
jgi:hypothetical protein